MEKLVQIDANCVSAIDCTELEVCVDQVEIEPEKPVQTKEYKKPVKSRLSKLFKKSKLNAKYIKESIPIESLKYKQSYWIYGVY